MPNISVCVLCCVDSRSTSRRSRLPSVPECIVPTPLYQQPAPPPPPPVPPPPPSTEDPRIWLERQKMKLVSRRAGAGSGTQTVTFGAPPGMNAEMVEQQRRLVEELKSAQSILRMRRRAQADETDDPHQRPQRTTSPPTAQNGIHEDKPNIPTADASRTKKPRSEPDAAPDSVKVYDQI